MIVRVLSGEDKNGGNVLREFTSDYFVGFLLVSSVATLSGQNFKSVILNESGERNFD